MMIKLMIGVSKEISSCGSKFFQGGLGHENFEDLSLEISISCIQLIICHRILFPYWFQILKIYDLTLSNHNMLEATVINFAT